MSTLATIGDRDLHPTTPFSKVFTMVYILLGVGVFVAFITKVTAYETRGGGVTSEPRELGWCWAMLTAVMER